MRSVKTFAGWLHRDGRARENVLTHLSAYNADTDQRRVRRACTPGELTLLIRAAENATVAMGMLGPDRAMAYRLAAGTGFRAGEIRSLTPESFDLDAQPPTVTVAASYSKRRRDDTQPIRNDLAKTLQPWLSGKPSGEPVLPLPEKAAKMMRVDLCAAGIDYQDDSGRMLDFHSLRHTYISRIVQSGASVKVAQELARHSTPTLTIGRYAHTRLHDLTTALDALPGDATNQEVQPYLATGTDDHSWNTSAAVGAATMARIGADGSEPVQDNGAPRKIGEGCKPLLNVGLGASMQPHASEGENGSSRIRTRDRGIMSPLL